MSSTNKRGDPKAPDIDPALVHDAINQLDTEIRLIEKWLDDLGEIDETDEHAVESRRAYRDKLHSRKEMRDALLVSRKKAD